jgi:hypothetical protein
MNILSSDLSEPVKDRFTFHLRKHTAWQNNSAEIKKLHKKYGLKLIHVFLSDSFYRKDGRRTASF